MLPIVCAGCGELLDRDAAVCRLCGEDNNASDAVDQPYEVPAHLELDKLQPWSRIKHEIIEKYARAYTRILRGQSWAKRYLYIDAFAGAGVALNPGSDVYEAAGALRILDVDPPFSEYHFIELNKDKANILQCLSRDRPEVTVHIGDYRDVLPTLLPRCRYEKFARALCLLDPYGLSVDYELLQKLGQAKSIEIFFNFMLVAANRNALWDDPTRVSPQRRSLMMRVWGNPGWIQELYTSQNGLFGPLHKKRSNEEVIAAYRKRLKAAGFSYVPVPIAMRNRLNAPIYFLFFCSPKVVAQDIVTDIFAQYR
jgi:three-Cys-motif partner protein